MKIVFGVFLSNKINKFISFEKMMPGLKYASLIVNRDRSDKSGTHWWSISKFHLQARILYLIQSL